MPADIKALTDVLASLVAAVSLLKRGSKKAAPSNKMFDMMVADYEKSIDRARDAIASYEAARETGWQPIETAPRDGTAIWLWWDGAAYLGYGEAANAIWNRGDRWFLKATVRRNPNHVHGERDEIVGTYVHGVEPSHWQPIPAAPLPEQEPRPELHKEDR